MQQPIDVAALNDSALEAQSFNEDMIRFLQEGFSANAPLEQWQVGYAYFLNKVAVYYSAGNTSE